MTRRKKTVIGLVVVVVLGGLAYANIGLKRTTGIAVTVEKIEARDLEAIVSASGKVQPKESVNISAETMGKVVNVAVEEGDVVTEGPVAAADRSAQPRDGGAEPRGQPGDGAVAARSDASRRSRTRRSRCARPRTRCGGRSRCSRPACCRARPTSAR